MSILLLDTLSIGVFGSLSVDLLDISVFKFKMKKVQCVHITVGYIVHSCVW